jgi:hypothetical protein
MEEFLDMKILKLMSEEVKEEIEVIEETVAYGDDEIEDILGIKPPTTEVMGHIVTLRNGNFVTLLTTVGPQGEPWAIVIQDEDGEILSKKFY